MRLLKRPGAAVFTLLLIVLGAAFLTQVVPYAQIVDSNRQVDESRAQLVSLQDENAELQADVDALKTDAEIEKLAREKLGYVRPGETAYVVLDPPGSADDEALPPASEPEPDQTWVDKVWDFLSGADLDS